MSTHRHRPVEDWRSLGACSSTPLELFYSDEEDVDATRAAKATCARCVVREACLEQALRDRERIGIWGGLTARERARILRRLRRSTAA